MGRLLRRRHASSLNAGQAICRFSPPSQRPVQWTENPRRKTPKKTSLSPITPLEQIRVIIADDHPVVREGLSSILSALEDVQVVAEAANGKEACELYDQHSPDVLIVDLRMREKDGLQVDLRVFSSNRIDVVRQLEKGRADLVIGSFNKLPNGIRRSRLLREDEVIAVRTGHPLTRGKVTKERLVEFPHVVVEATGTKKNETDGFTDGQGADRRVGIERALREFQAGKVDLVGRTAVCVPNFAAVAPFLQLSDMVAALPRRLALWAAAHAPLVLLDPPYKSMMVEIEMLWDQGADQDQGLQWLVNELAESIGDSDS
jgi:DNA-binding transcriptional LysR family regulator